MQMWQWLDTIATEASVESTPVVCEILDIFPKEITGMSLPREVDFCINLALGAAPISKAPYRMALTELKELKN